MDDRNRITITLLKLATFPISQEPISIIVVLTAIDARSMAQKFNTLLPEEADLAKVSERQAKEALARVTGDAKDPVTRNQELNLQDQEKYPKPLQPVK